MGIPTSSMGNGASRGVQDPPWDPHSSNDKLPKLTFPRFDGENPRLWIRQCNDYFEMYNVAPRRWIEVSTTHLSEAAAR